MTALRRRWWTRASPGLPAALAVLTVLVLWGEKWGPHGDELYFRMLPLRWWYEDQPPLTVWLTHLSSILSATATAFPGDGTGSAAGQAVWGQRLPAAVAAAAGALLAAALPRAQGYGRRVQAVSAWAHAFTVYPLIVGHVFLTGSLDLLVAQGVLLGVVVSLRGRPRGLVWAGLVAGAGCWNKLLVLPLVAAVGVGLLVRRRDLLRTREAWLGVAALMALALPQLAAQAVHGWPMRDVAADLMARDGALNRWLVLPLVIALTGPPFLAVCGRGLGWTGSRTRRIGDLPAASRSLLARLPHGPLAVAAALLLLWNLWSPAQPYYAVGLFLVATSLGWGPAARAGSRVWRRARAVVAANAVVAAVIALPLVPAHSPAFDVVAAINPTARAQTGWNRLAEASDRAREDDGSTVLADSYALAGALRFYGGTDGRPVPVASGHNALWDLGPPRTDGVLLVGERAVAHGELFRRCEDAGTLDGSVKDPYGVAGSPMLRCEGPRGGCPGSGRPSGIWVPEDPEGAVPRRPRRASDPSEGFLGLYAGPRELERRMAQDSTARTISRQARARISAAPWTRQCGARCTRVPTSAARAHPARNRGRPREARNRPLGSPPGRDPPAGGGAGSSRRGRGAEAAAPGISPRRPLIASRIADPGRASTAPIMCTPWRESEGNSPRTTRPMPAHSRATTNQGTGIGGGRTPERGHEPVRSSSPAEHESTPQSTSAASKGRARPEQIHRPSAMKQVRAPRSLIMLTGHSKRTPGPVRARTHAPGRRIRDASMAQAAARARRRADRSVVPRPPAAGPAPRVRPAGGRSGPPRSAGTP